MTDIQRWSTIPHEVRDGIAPREKGEYVLYADHVAAVAAAQREGANQGYLNGVATNADNSFKAGVKAARDAVDRIEHWASYSPDGDVWACFASDPLDAIDALTSGEGRNTG